MQKEIQKQVWQGQELEKHISKECSCLPSLLEHRQLEKALIKSSLKGSATIPGAKSYLAVSSPFGTLHQGFLYSSFTPSLDNFVKPKKRGKPVGSANAVLHQLK